MNDIDMDPGFVVIPFSVCVDLHTRMCSSRVEIVLSVV